MHTGQLHCNAGTIISLPRLEAPSGQGPHLPIVSAKRGSICHLIGMQYIFAEWMHKWINVSSD